MSSNTLLVFVSSTWLDLQPERLAVEKALQRMRETKFVGMEYFGSRNETTHKASLDEVDQSQVYIGIFGGRYGSGITESEYRRARELGLPCFIYFKSEEKVTAAGRDGDEAKAATLTTLKDELRHNHDISDFSTPDELAAKVTADMHRWLFSQYLTPKLEAAAKETKPRAEIKSLLSGIKDTSELDEDLLARLRKVGYVVVKGRGNIAVGGNVDRSVFVPGSGNVVNVYGDDADGKKFKIAVIAPIVALLAVVVFIGFLVHKKVIGSNQSDGIYHVRVRVVDPQNHPAEDADVTSSIGGERKKVEGGWEFVIPVTNKPEDGKMTINATWEAAYMNGHAELQLGDDHNPAITVQLKHNDSAKVRGQVEDARGKLLAGARVWIDGYRNEGITTGADGYFELPAHAAVGQQVRLNAEKLGYNTTIQGHQAGNEPATITLLK